MFTILDDGREIPFPTRDGELRLPSGRIIVVENGVTDFMPRKFSQTAAHYGEQWGPSINYPEFARNNPDAMKITLGRQLGWYDLFDRIREESCRHIVTVYDAACGFGAIADALFRDPVPAGLQYLGADIHDALKANKKPKGVDPERIRIIRWDISDPLPIAQKFDYVLCRAALHHTPDPARSFAALVQSLKVGGTLAISTYAIKARVREIVDDALRNDIHKMPNAQALTVINEFTRLARDIQKTAAKITIESDLKYLGIPKGSYNVHAFIYDFLMKNWYNESFGERYSDVVNFDWYHPAYAYRYSIDELKAWFRTAGLTITGAASVTAQHYLEGVLSDSR